MVDKMLMTYQKKKEKEFIKEGGIKERMTMARLQYRNQQNLALEAAHYEIAVLQKENAELREMIIKLQKELEFLKK
jgi:four helix bundle suffix protein